MENEAEFKQRFMDFIRERGYKEEILASEWLVGLGRRVDLAAIDRETKEPIALFELAIKKDSTRKKRALDILKHYSLVASLTKLPRYAVFPGTEIEPFEIYELEDDTEQDPEKAFVRTTYLPHYNMLKNSVNLQKIKKTTTERDYAQKQVFGISIFLAITLTILLCLDFLKIINITPQRLVLIGLIVGLIVLPFANKLKVLGIEFERFVGKKK